MKALGAVAAAGLILMSALGPASSQPWGGRDYGYGGGYYQGDEFEEGGPRYKERAIRVESRG